MIGGGRVPNPSPERKRASLKTNGVSTETPHWRLGLG